MDEHSFTDTKFYKFQESYFYTYLPDQIVAGKQPVREVQRGLLQRQVGQKQPVVVWQRLAVVVAVCLHFCFQVRLIEILSN
jgi:hypothetical protein